MKKIYLLLICLCCSSFLFAQNNDFNNGGGDFLWSNAANWTLGAVPVSVNTVRSSIDGSIVDSNYTISKIQNIFGTNNDVNFEGLSVLTINPNVANGYGIENVSSSDVSLIFNGNVNINNPSGFTRFRNLNGSANILEFEAASLLTLTTNLEIFSGSNNSGFIFNGTIEGTGNFRLGANTSVTFGNSVSNASYSGELVQLANSSIIVNTNDNVVFYGGLKIQVNGDDASTTLNGENVFNSGITVGGSNTFTFNVNKNQNSMTNIVFQGDGALNMVIDNSVTNLSFADNSTNAWNTGTLNITGFTEGVIRFGTDDTALTTTQLSQITADNGGQQLALDSSGFLVNIGSLNHDFTNSGGDFIWSNPANWSVGVVPNSNTKETRLPLTVESIVDVDFTIKKIQTTFATPGSVAVAGSSTLTLNPDEANFTAIDNVSNNNAILSFKGNVEINNPSGFTLMRNLNGASNIIEFADGSTLTLTTNLSTSTGSNNAGFQFNGSLSGSGNLRFGANTTSTFGSTTSNPSYLGELPFLEDASVIVNTADNNIFYNGSKLQINGNNASIVLNGANVFASGITVGGSNTFTFTANKNQNNIQNIVFSAGGTLNLVIGNNVTDLSFVDNSGSNWSSGTVDITGFKEGVIRFGADASGLTSGQLNQIIADNGGKPFELDENGYLVNVPDFRYSGGAWSPNNPITGAIPSTATDNIFIENGTPVLTGILVANGLRIANGATLNIAPVGILDLNRDIFNSGSLVFQSDVNGSGQLDEFFGTIIGSGDVKVERFIPQSNRAFRYMSSSVNTIGSIHTNLQEGANNPNTSTNNNPDPGYGTHITGSTSGANGFDATETGSPSMFEFDEQTQDWVAITNTDPKKMNIGEAYALMIRGDRSTDLNTNTPPVTPTTLRFTGSLRTGDYSVLSDDLSSTIDNYNLVANPYQAIVNLKSLLQSTDATDLDDQTIYIYDSTLGTRGGYATVDLSANPVTSTPYDPTITDLTDANENLMPNQAFFVKTTGNSPALIFKESHKNTTTDFVETFSVENEIAQIHINLKRQPENLLVDGVTVRFDASFSNAVDAIDADEVWNFDERVALFNSNHYLSIEKRAIPEEGEEIQIYTDNYKTDAYIWQINMTNVNREAVLYDSYTDSETPIATNEISHIAFSVDNTLPESTDPFRFQVRFKEETLSLNEEDISSLAIYPNPVTQNRFSIRGLATKDAVHLQLFDMAGRLVYSCNELAENEIQIDIQQALPVGIYQLKIEQNEAVFFEKLMISK